MYATCLPQGSDTIECKICGKEKNINNKKDVFIKNFIERTLPELFEKCSHLPSTISFSMRKKLYFSIVPWGRNPGNTVWLDFKTKKINKKENFPKI